MRLAAVVVQKETPCRDFVVDGEIVAFDLLHLERYDVTALALHDRKRLLKRALDFVGHVHFTPHRVESGAAFLGQACRKGWEGLIAKRADASYQPRRSRFGALLVGTYEDGALRYAGKVGTGFDDALLAELGGRLARLERETCPQVRRERAVER